MKKVLNPSLTKGKLISRANFFFRFFDLCPKDLKYVGTGIEAELISLGVQF